MTTHHRSARSRVFLLTALLALPLACGPFHRGPEPARIIFINESIDQANVYAQGPDGVPTRIGTVLGRLTDTLIVPSTISGQGGSINIIARIFAKSAAPQTGVFVIAAGQTMQVRLSSDEKMLVVMPGGE